MTTTTTTAPATTVQLFVSYFDLTTDREWFDTEDHDTTREALQDLIGTAAELGWEVTPEVDEDGKIVYRLSGDDIRDGLATLG
ncbi:hypothetical protein CH267_01085 [Rhodococcus sp. 06-621-2]|nr:hypothetical protein [Rhodococcus sp. 06-621-2]OZC62168.1 hypothetical protein CH267_01085 [Rhodococcus sp. 06-621-2]